MSDDRRKNLRTQGRYGDGKVQKSRDKKQKSSLGSKDSPEMRFSNRSNYNLLILVYCSDFFSLHRKLSFTRPLSSQVKRRYLKLILIYLLINLWKGYFQLSHLHFYIFKWFLHWITEINFLFCSFFALG